MGNCCSCECFGSPCWPCGPKKVPNLPPRPVVVEKPKPEQPTSTENVDTLVIKEWNMEHTKNGTEHHTADYAQMTKNTPSSSSSSTEEEDLKIGHSSVVVRRGQTFLLTLQLNVPFDAQKHKMSLIFSVEDCNANFGNFTEVGVMVGDEEGMNGWWVKVHSQEGSTLTLQVHSSSSAIVGQWRVEVDTDTQGITRTSLCPHSIFIIFNPWCKDDSVYISDEDEREEYVSSDTGLIWRGTHSRLRPCPWNFGQFEKNILECVLHLLKKLCQLLPAHMADPVGVVRALSAGINSPDDSGVLVGNWSGKYTGGRSPTEWRGSVEILQEFFAKKKSVKFGQCWVFSGVLTTACRALGIPCRSVTNFSSAHDTHNSLTIDYIFGEDGNAMEELNADSVWNFHVWNEAWMKRPDLGDDYGGWQVIDATPQEQSDGQFRCGPSSLVAVKRGEIHLPYDVSFVYAEVNADKLFWKYRGKRRPMKLMGRKTGGIGLNISTKATKAMSREDITNLYKYKEGGEEERSVMFRALRRCENAFARYYLNQQLEDVEFQLHLEDDIVIGKSFTVTVTVENKSENEHEVAVTLRADTMLYTGVVKELVKKFESHVVMKPQSKQNVEMLVTFDNYYKKLVDQCAFSISCLGKVKTTDFEYFAQDDFRVRKPDIKIKCLSDDVYVGTPCTWIATFDNPLNMKLTKGRFYALPSTADSSFIKLKKPVDEEAIASVDFDITPRKVGDMTVTVIFTSKELEDVDGFVTQTVMEPKKPEPVSEDGAAERVENNKEETTEMSEVEKGEDATDPKATEDSEER